MATYKVVLEVESDVAQHEVEARLATMLNSGGDGWVAKVLAVAETQSSRSGGSTLPRDQQRGT
ncbi:TPA: hypothetical protein DCE37_06795 [Candidatus Latescibacteria bacterium]|nr:hypothetical protein [Candidatus Latescibacterota bacterium]